MMVVSVYQAWHTEQEGVSSRGRVVTSRILSSRYAARLLAAPAVGGENEQAHSILEYNTPVGRQVFPQYLYQIDRLVMYIAR